MKKVFFVVTLLALFTTLAACGTSTEVVSLDSENQTTASGNTTNTSSQPPETAGDRLMPVAMKLALGIFKLEETDMPIDAEQAQQLLPLWKAVRTLSESETAASQEIQAVLNQIQGTLTTEQIQAIDAMQLTMADMNALAESLGLDFGGGGRFGNLTPEMQATMQAARESGQAPPGGFGGGMGPGMGGGPGGGAGGEAGSVSPEVRQTAMAEWGTRGGSGLGINPALLEAVIKFLTEKI